VSETEDQIEPAGRAYAWGVHLLTASGAVFGFLAVVAAFREQYLSSFAWMAVTVMIDSVDGALARFFRVKDRVPHVDGALLDNIVDFFTWSIVPAFFLYMSPLLSGPWRWPAVAAVIIASGYQFSRTDAKTEDHSFSGFPSYWNIVVFYMFVLDTPPWLNFMVIIACAVASFLPIRCLYPSRTEIWRLFNVAFSCFWAACLIMVLLRYPEGHGPYLKLSWVYVLYYVVFSVWLTLRGLKAKLKAHEKETDHD
jgi:phosphatidylcholine synthase